MLYNIFFSSHFGYIHPRCHLLMSGWKNFYYFRLKLPNFKPKLPTHVSHAPLHSRLFLLYLDRVAGDLCCALYPQEYAAEMDLADRFPSLYRVYHLPVHGDPAAPEDGRLAGWSWFFDRESRGADQAAGGEPAVCRYLQQPGVAGQWLYADRADGGGDRTLLFESYGRLFGERVCDQPADSGLFSDGALPGADPACEEDLYHGAFCPE